jgi:hypothetical protein
VKEDVVGNRPEVDVMDRSSGRLRSKRQPRSSSWTLAWLEVWRSNV